MARFDRSDEGIDTVALWAFLLVMKSPCSKLIVTLVAACMFPAAHAGVITLTAKYNDGTNNTAELSIGPYEIAELVSFPHLMNQGSFLYIIKDGDTFVHSVPNAQQPEPFDPVTIAGPATLRLKAANQNSSALCTIRVSPEAFPPDRTILVPPGTNQARITLECSTNLVQWSAATNGVYGPLPEAKFFRIKLEPLP